MSTFNQTAEYIFKGTTEQWEAYRQRLEETMERRHVGFPAAEEE